MSSRLPQTLLQKETFHCTMARKKQTARKSTQKGKLPHEVWPQWVQQVQGPAPVRQKEDSEDEVVQQPITNNWIACKLCYYSTTNQDRYYDIRVSDTTALRHKGVRHKGECDIRVREFKGECDIRVRNLRVSVT